MTLEPDRIVGRYRVLKPLGSGGMGSVYEVEHIRLGNRYALKVFSFEGSNHEFLRKRFLSEGRLLARLNHPQIVRVHDMDVEDSFAWFAMDFVKGPDGVKLTLADVPQAGAAPEAQVAGWYADVRAALQAVHAAGIVHRDVKLENILIGSDGHAVLSDFGISKVVDDRLRREISVTRTMVSAEADRKIVMGTAAYLAPEIRSGTDYTPAADLYALGIAFFRLLTGLWYEPGPHAFDLLAPFDRRWRKVFAALLAEKPEDRSDPEIAPTNARHRKYPSTILWAVFSAVVASLVTSVIFCRLRSVPPMERKSVGSSQVAVEEAFSIPDSVR